jgi:hypothetical protein
MLRRTLFAMLAATALLGGCAGGGTGGFGIGGYRLVEPREREVAGRMRVIPTMRWNRAPRSLNDLSREENWTMHGVTLDGLTFIAGLEDGKELVRWQRRTDIRQVPRFRADMSPPEIAAMIESFYRIRAGSVSFDMTGLQPRSFLGQPGFQFDYRHLGGDELERQGRVVGTVIGRRLYMIMFDAPRSHYFPSLIAEVERIVESARLGARS